MAGMDYTCCIVCGIRIYYDGCIQYDLLENYYRHIALCKECAKTHKLQARKWVNKKKKSRSIIPKLEEKRRPKMFE